MARNSYQYKKIWEEHNNRKVPRGYHIHHIDGNHANNHPENLYCCPPEEHTRIHIEQGDIVAIARDKFIFGAAAAGYRGGKAGLGINKGHYNCGDTNPTKREDVRAKMRGPRGPQPNMKGRVGRKKKLYG
jgi:hypothetical protein